MPDRKVGIWASQGGSELQAPTQVTKLRKIRSVIELPNEIKSLNVVAIVLKVIFAIFSKMFSQTFFTWPSAIFNVFL